MTVFVLNFFNYFSEMIEIDVSIFLKFGFLMLVLYVFLFFEDVNSFVLISEHCKAVGFRVVHVIIMYMIS